MADDRIASLDLLVPVVRDRIRNLLVEVEGRYVRGQSQTRWQVFETYRSPARQLRLRAMGATKAGPWQSGHQFGLAADIVPVDEEGRWYWPPATSEVWNELRSNALRVGLDAPISWDRAHVEHSGMLADIRTILRT